MFIHTHFYYRALFILGCTLLPGSSFAETNYTPIKPAPPLSTTQIVQNLGWVETGQNRCGGYYLDAPFLYPEDLQKNKIIITSNQFLFAQRGTSYGQGKVTITRYGQQMVANKAYIFRDPATGEIRSIELLDNVTLREPDRLVIAHKGSYDIKTKSESLHDILYRATIYNNFQYQAPLPSLAELQAPRKIFQLSAWGEAAQFKQDKPKVYEFDQASYSTCPPTRTVWQVKASHIELNQESGRGYAKHARLLFKGIPVFYSPYINFPIDARRQTGLLWPTVGRRNNSGTYFAQPFYWNMAPNYDMTITPAILTERGMQFNDLFRYLTPTSKGSLMGEVLPGDKEFSQFKKKAAAVGQYGESDNPITKSELRSLQKSSPTRTSFDWENHTRFNENWSANVDYNIVSDDYYLRDFSNNLNSVTQNQLLQEGEINYKNPNWDFTTRIQGYQTLHPLDGPKDNPVQFLNQYTRLPQIILNGSYPDRPAGFEYFIQNEVTHFSIDPNPGTAIKLPVGNRLYTQPGISRPINYSYLSVIPRLQFSATKYEVGDVTGNNSKNPSRTLPIFDINSTFYFDRKMGVFGHPYRQTLEPQIYYVYIPYKNQNELPVFDTTVNTLTYDQLFLYNRFSGIDRINDANQVTFGVATRFIDQQTGTEKIKAAIGEIFYFRKRSVTLCGGPDAPWCSVLPNDKPGDADNTRNLSPIAGLLNYTINPDWSFNANAIVNPLTNKIDNESFGFHYQPPGTQKIINLGYNYIRAGDVYPGESPSATSSNLSSTDLSINWPVFSDWSATGRWTQNWNHHHFQNLLYGLQYDSCCWAVRLVTGRSFTGLGPSNLFRYNTQFYLQLALKGLGTVPITGGDPSQMLSNNISGFQNNFGRDF
jgi:LPS-assembly protein